MKTLLAQLGFSAIAIIAVEAAVEPSYTNFIRQVQMPADANGNSVTYDASVSPTGSQDSALEINPGGARFELWTVKSPAPTVNYLLDTSYVGAYVPISKVVIDSDDTYGRDLTYTGAVPKNISAMIRRTRADKPFRVYITTSGLLSGATDPDASKSVKLLRHVQSYGTTNGATIDRTQATLFSQASISQNGTQTLTYALNSIPGANRSKVRGEERFSVFSLEDYQAPEQQLTTQYIQVWPVADATLSGITANQLIRFAMPTVTLTLNDLYPDSRTYAQVYKGNQVLGTTGTIVPGSHLIVNDAVPNSRVLTLSNYDTVLNEDGRWTMEIVTVTPFGIDRLAYISFDLDRVIEVNGMLSNIE